MRLFLHMAGAVAIVAGLVVSTPAAAQQQQQQQQQEPLPTVSPTPQSISPFPGGVDLPDRLDLDAAPGTDPAAVAAVTAVLHAAGVTDLTGGGLTVHVGGPAENPGSGAALRRLGVPGPDGLAPGGYVLAVGHHEVVLAGVDGAGTFYAVQTLRQLVEWRHGHASVPGVVVRDWPALAMRGGMESFYGNPWPRADLLHQLDFLGQHKLNAFQYTPSGDPRVASSLWRSPYPADQAAAFREAVARATANHVDFLYRIDPESQLDPAAGICHSSPADLAALVGRYQQLWDLGMRTMSLGWDDVGGRFVCTGDQQRFGADVNPLAAAQASVVSYVNDHFVATHPGARLVTVPTDYAGDGPSAYRSRFAALIPATVQVFWTGPQVISRTITNADLTRAQAAFGGRRLLIFDNYPVNDYVTNQQHLGPLVGRDPAIAGSALGLLANEMQQEEPSLLSLFTVADFAWHPAGYDAQASWTRSLREFGGAAYGPLRAYAENSVASPLTSEVSPVVAPLIADFERAYRAHADLASSATALLGELETVRTARDQLRATLPDNAFLTESDPFLRALTARATASEAAVRALLAANAGDEPAAWHQRQLMGRAMLDSIATGTIVASGVYDQLFEFARAPIASTVVQADNGAMSDFARGADGQLDTSWQPSPGSNWHAYTPLSGLTMLGQPDVIVGRSGAMAAVVRGSDQQVWTNWQLGAGGAWHGWVAIGGSVADDPRLVQTDNGALSVFARGADGLPYTAWQSTEGGAWSAPVALPGVTMLGRPEAIVGRDDAISLFVRGADNQVWTNWRTAGAWHGWVAIGGAITDNPRAIQNNDGAFTVLARGADGRPWAAAQNGEGGGWGAFAALPGTTMLGTPAVGLGNDGLLSAYVRGGDNRIWTNWQLRIGGPWHGWVSLGGSAVGSPDVVKSFGSAFSAFALRGDGHMYTSWQYAAGSNWAPWTNIGGNLAP